MLVNDRPCKAGQRLQANDLIVVTVPPPPPIDLVPEAVDFGRLYEDDDLVVVAKPPGVVVHPSCGHQQGTLVHGLLFHCPTLTGGSSEQRPGIVHRLDKDTSGVLVVAKNEASHQALLQQFKNREVEKIYLAILDGQLTDGQGRINEPIGRHPVNRKKMAVRRDGGREAATRWQVLERFADHTYVQLELETGRTHQIRVHMAHLGHPVSGDTVYGSRARSNIELGAVRQCLHAHRLAFNHPSTGQRLTFTASLWEDMAAILEKLRQRDGEPLP